uniref:DUF1353 domain-containing protein n=2 Tax=viral metagenome TaxID=1070528 RepID=A0A6M3XY19_9ZZZZ
MTDNIFELVAPLVYESDLLKYTITVLVGFQSDGASVPRVPIAYMLFGDRAHHESVIHDYLYRIDAFPEVTRSRADDVFLEAMKCRGKGFFVRYAMWMGVRSGGWMAYHKKKVADKL